MRARSNNDQRKADFRRRTRSQCLGGSLLSKRYVVQRTLWNITREIEVSRKRWTSLNTSGQCPVGMITLRELFRGRNHFWRPSLPTACMSVESCEILTFRLFNNSDQSWTHNCIYNHVTPQALTVTFFLPGPLTILEEPGKLFIFVWQVVNNLLHSFSEKRHILLGERHNLPNNAVAASLHWNHFQSFAPSLPRHIWSTAR